MDAASFFDLIIVWKQTSSLLLLGNTCPSASCNRVFQLPALPASNFGAQRIPRN
jgi:hypothetical protein